MPPGRRRFYLAGTNGGISRLHRTQRTWKTYSKKEGLPDSEIKALVKVGQKMWAGAIDGSLFEYDAAPDRWKKIEPTDPSRTGESIPSLSPRTGCSSAGTMVRASSIFRRPLGIPDHSDVC